MSHLVCNTEKTQRVHVYREGQDWQKNKTLGALLGEEQDVTRRMQLAGLAFWHVWSVRRSQCITKDLCVECLGQTSTTLWLWDMGTECNNDRETLCSTSLTSMNPSRLSLAKAHTQ